MKRWAPLIVVCVLATGLQVARFKLTRSGLASLSHTQRAQAKRALDACLDDPRNRR